MRAWKFFQWLSFLYFYKYKTHTEQNAILFSLETKIEISMIIIRKNILSLFTGVIILSLLFNPVKGILDIPHQSCLFTSISLSILIGISTFFSRNRLIQRPTVIDWLFILIAIINCYLSVVKYTKWIFLLSQNFLISGCGHSFR